MTKFKKIFASFLIGLMSTIFLIDLVLATTLSLNISAGEEVNHKIELKVDDQLTIQFNAIGEGNNQIFFSIIYPNATETKFGEVISFSKTLDCTIEGEYTLKFVNSDPNQSRLVTLNYNIEKYIFGMPKLFFLAFVIAVICLIMIAACALMGKSL